MSSLASHLLAPAAAYAGGSGSLPPLSPWLIVLPVLGGVVFFAGLWTAIGFLIGASGGYRSLLAHRTADAGAGQALPSPRWVIFGSRARYRGRMMHFTASADGLGIRVHRMCRGHPDLRVPWARVEVAGPAGDGVKLVLDGRVDVLVPRDFADALAAARLAVARRA